MHFYSDEIQQSITDHLTIDGEIDKKEFMDLVDLYHFLPIKIKKDRNYSENLYYILNSNKRGTFQDKEQILHELKDKNDRMHLSKIMTLIAIKIEEKFSSVAKAFLFFDVDGD